MYVLCLDICAMLSKFLAELHQLKVFLPISLLNFHLVGVLPKINVVSFDSVIVTFSNYLYIKHTCLDQLYDLVCSILKKYLKGAMLSVLMHSHMCVFLEVSDVL